MGAGARTARATVAALWRCSHPGPTVAVTAFTTLLAVGAGRGWGAVWTAAAVLAGQLSVGWSNDWYDRHRDRAASRRDKPLVAGTVDDRVVGAGAVAAVVACGLLSLASGLAATGVHLAAVASAWGYNLGLKATAASVAPYALSFGLLPAFVTLGPPLRAWPPVWAVAAGALLGAGAHFTNVLPDLDTDAATGIRGLPHRLGRRASALLAGALLAGGGAALASGATRPLPPVAAVALAGGALLAAAVVPAGLARRGRLAFRLAIGASAAVVVAFVSVGVGVSR